MKNQDPYPTLVCLDCGAPRISGRYAHRAACPVGIDADRERDEEARRASEAADDVTIAALLDAAGWTS